MDISRMLDHAVSGASGKAGGLNDLNRSKRLVELRRSGTLTYAGKSRRGASDPRRGQRSALDSFLRRHCGKRRAVRR